MIVKDESKIQDNEIENIVADSEIKESKKKAKKKLTSKDKIVALEVEVAELKDKYIRSAAEFDNFRRRSALEKQNWIKNATERVMLEICDVQDNFERALHSDNEKTDEKSYKKGIELIYQQLSNIMKKEGISKIESLNSEFDPKFHEALAHIPSDLEENIVVAVIQNGYKMNEKIIRPARVAVSNGQTPETPTE